MEKLLEMGAKMGLKDEELKQFVRDEQSRMRDEREKDRSERQAKEEREFKLQMEKEYSDRAREERQHQLEMEARKEEFAASEHQRKIQELEADQQFQAAEKCRNHPWNQLTSLKLNNHLKALNYLLLMKQKTILMHIFSGSKDMLLRRTGFVSTGDHILVHF